MKLLRIIETAHVIPIFINQEYGIINKLQNSKMKRGVELIT